MQIRNGEIWVDPNASSEYRHSLALVRSIANDTEHTTTISTTQEPHSYATPVGGPGAGTNGVAADTDVRWSMNDSFEVVRVDLATNTISRELLSEPAMALFHELLHADHNRRGVRRTDVGAYQTEGQTIMEEAEELRTVGIPHVYETSSGLIIEWNDGAEHVSENDIRREHGMHLRASY